MDDPKFIISNYKEESIRTYRVKILNANTMYFTWEKVQNLQNPELSKLKS